MQTSKLLSAQSWLWMVVLFAVAFTLRLPFRSALPYHWDSAEFALAIRDYNIVHSQPHAPGYFLYVMLGRIVNLVVGDPHASLVWMSVLAGSALVPIVYLLGRALFDQRVGMIAGLLTMTSPQVWFHSEVALTYIVDALLVSLIALLCWRAIQRGGTWGDAVLIGVLVAIAGGVRQQSVPALAPVLFYTFWRFDRHSLAKLAVAGVIAFALAWIWFAPMVAMTGGLSTYLNVVRRHAVFNAPATFAGGGPEALMWNVFFIGLFSANGLMLATIPLVTALFYRAFAMDKERRRLWNDAHACALNLLIAWVGGMVLMGTVVGFVKQPGYVLNLLPGLLLLAAVALAQLGKKIMLPSVVIICAFNVFAFVGWPHAWDRVFFGTARTAREIHMRSEQLRNAVAAIRAECVPRESVVCHARQYLHFGLKQFQWLLPEFEQYQLTPDLTMLAPADKPIMASINGRLMFVAGIDWTGKQKAILIVPPDLTVKVFGQYFDLQDVQPVTGSSGLVCAAAAIAWKTR